MVLTWESFEAAVFIPFTYFTRSFQRVWIPYLVISYLMAFYLTWKESRTEESGESEEREPKKSILAKIFPKEVFFHRSAIVDYCYFYSNTIFYAFLTAPSIFSLAKVSFGTFRFWQSLLGETVILEKPGVLVQVVYALCLILAIDLGLFLAHWIQHVTPFLWSFHKVHHSAEVLTPLTVYRMHPLDDMIHFLFSGILAGMMEGTFRYFVSFNLSPFLIGGMNVFLFIFYVAFYNLRHSHIWCSYGPFWSRIFISPAQHQIHHSVEAKHWNKNYGFMFAIWDGVLGSLYVPKGKEKIVFGVGDHSEKEYSNFLLLYLLPFRDAFRVLCKKFATKSEVDPSRESKSD